jgi:hypothetical protein
MFYWGPAELLPYLPRLEVDAQDLVLEGIVGNVMYMLAHVWIASAVDKQLGESRGPDELRSEE